MSIVILLALIVVASLACHYLIKSIVLASVISSVVATAVHQIIAYISLGYYDPFMAIALIITLLIGFFISLLIGFAFAYDRRKVKL
jgi:predicted Na+-dependent transporter